MRLSLALLVLAAAAAPDGSPQTAVFIALIGAGATVLVAVLGLVGTVLVNRRRAAGTDRTDADPERDFDVLARGLVEALRERDTEAQRADKERRRADACERREQERGEP